MEEQATCINCGAPLWWKGRGPPLKRCQDCGGPSYPEGTKLVPQPAQPSQRTKARQAKDNGLERSAAVQDYLQAMRTAVWLGITGDEAKAVELATGGSVPQLDPENARQLAELAAEHTELVEGRQTATASIITRWLALAAIEALEKLPLITPGQIASSMRTAQQALDGFGGGRLAFTNIKVHFGEPEDE